ncbi:tryptophanase [Syntrophus gentianae]|uniref:Tryptophanase n=1 Tax=Syntrophus gentianae TaxID=43775 RepID=A0A1H8A2B1_9BACT|nr:tryptophanase [Syntrophus gentianae]SEM63978.1 tryptophanase [Syntrophus gentianae]
MMISLPDGRRIPVEMHRVKIVQKINLLPADQRLECLRAVGYNTFLLQSQDVFLDMLTDSGTNAMSDNQLAAMMVADDAYAGSASFVKLANVVKKIFGFEHTLPVHQGRAAEHLLVKVFLKAPQVVLNNYHFPSTRVHVEIVGSRILDLVGDDALIPAGSNPFKGNIDIAKLRQAIEEHGPENVAFIRMEATTNLIGGQPFSMQNLREVREVATKNGLLLILDGSLIGENAYFIKKREAGYADKSIQEILLEMMGMVDIFYMSGRKSGGARGGLIATNNKEYFQHLMNWLPVYEGFSTYGGMSTKEIEAMAVGLEEMTETEVAGSSPQFIEYFAERLQEYGVPVVTPPGGLACHVDAKAFLPHIPPLQYPAEALNAAMYLVSGARGVERGTMSEDRDAKGDEIVARMELVRIAIPRRAFTLGQIEYVAQRVSWLYQHRDLIGGLRFVEEPPVMRFFFGRLEPLGGDWGKKIVDAFQADFGKEL